VQVWRKSVRLQRGNGAVPIGQTHFGCGEGVGLMTRDAAFGKVEDKRRWRFGARIAARANGANDIEIMYVNILAATQSTIDLNLQCCTFQQDERPRRGAAGGRQRAGGRSLRRASGGGAVVGSTHTAAGHHNRNPVFHGSMEWVAARRLERGRIGSTFGTYIYIYTTIFQFILILLALLCMEVQKSFGP
jgi:hypothetical protein